MLLNVIKFISIKNFNEYNFILSANEERIVYEPPEPEHEANAIKENFDDLKERKEAIEGLKKFFIFIFKKFIKPMVRFVSENSFDVCMSVMTNQGVNNKDSIRTCNNFQNSFMNFNAFNKF